MDPAGVTEPMVEVPGLKDNHTLPLILFPAIFLAEDEAVVSMAKDGGEGSQLGHLI